MLENITNDLSTQGPLGILAALSLAANVIQWRRGIKLQDGFFERIIEHYVQLVTAVVELVTLVRARQK